MSKRDCVVAVVELNNHFALVRGEDGSWDFPVQTLDRGEMPSGAVAKRLAFNRAALVTDHAMHLGMRDAGQGNLAAYYLLDGVEGETRDDVKWATAEEVKSTTHRFNPLWDYIGRLEKV